MIKYVGIDLDGTIADTIPFCIKAFVNSVSPFTEGTLSTEEIVQVFGLNEEGMIKKLVGDKWEAALNAFYIEYEKALNDGSEPFPGIVELIEELREKGVAVGLITGKGARSCHLTLDKYKISHLFEHVETGDPEKNRKSEAISDILKSQGLQKDEFVYIGDAISDIIACKEVGVLCLSASWDSTSDYHLQEAHNPGHVFKRIADLRQYLIG